MKILTLSKPYLLSHKYTLTAYVAILLTSTAITILSPYIVGGFLDNLIEGGDISVIIRFAVIFGGLNVLKIIKGYTTAAMYVKMSTRMSNALNMDAIKHIQRLSLSYSNKEDSAYLSQRTGTDSGSMIGFSISILQNILTNVVLLAVPFVVLLTMNRFVTLLMAAFIAVYTALYFAFRKPLYNAGLAFRESQAKFFARLYEQIKYIRLIKLNSIQAEMNKRAEAGFASYFGTAVHNQKVSYIYSGMDGFVSTIAQIVLFVTGGIQILNGNFTVGMFTVFTSYFNMMLGAGRYFFGVGAAYQQALASYDRLKDILDKQPEGNGITRLNTIKSIEVRGLGFSYGGYDSTDGQSAGWESANGMSAGRENANGMIAGNRSTVNGFSTLFEKGNMYAVAGENGAGKSTIISLLMGMYIDEYEGGVYYDGVDIRDIDMYSARKELIGFAEQEPQLVDESVWFNLCFGDDTPRVGYASQVGYESERCESREWYERYERNEWHERYERLVRLLGMEGFLQSAGNGTRNTETGAIPLNTSGGEKQKIAILRVLLKNPDVMIFDEPTSALDTAAVVGFMEYLCEVKRDKIVIIITHDRGVIEYCDAVISV